MFYWAASSGSVKHSGTIIIYSTNKSQTRWTSQQFHALCEWTLSTPFLYVVSWMKSGDPVARLCCQGSVFVVESQRCSQYNSVNELICSVWSSLTQYLVTVSGMSALANCNCQRMVTMAIIAGAECVLKANRSVLAPQPAGRMSLTGMRVTVF